MYPKSGEIFLVNCKIVKLLLTLCRLGIFSCFFFCRQLMFPKPFRSTICVSSILDPDQVLQFVVPDLGSNCLQRLSADDTRRQRIKRVMNHLDNA